MCECLCSAIKGDVTFHVKGAPATFVVDAYMGCQECARLVGLDVRAFDMQGAQEWLDGNRGVTVTPDEYGVVPTAISFEMFSIDDLADAFQNAQIPVPEDYGETWRDVLDDMGVRILRDAFNICQRRKENKNG